MLNLGSVTDAYQPVERRLRITRAVVEVLAEHRHAFSVITKSSLVERDLDLIAPLAAAAPGRGLRLDHHARRRRWRVCWSRAPRRRSGGCARIETLARAGVPVGVSVSPVIPFLNEPELERILDAAAAAGASRAFSVVLRLPWEVSPLFQQWLEQHFPERAARVMARVREMRGGRDNDARFGSRMTGQGVWAELLRQRFDKACARLGLNRERIELDLTRFRRPAADAAQASLF